MTEGSPVQSHRIDRRTAGPHRGAAREEGRVDSFLEPGACAVWEEFDAVRSFGVRVERSGSGSSSFGIFGPFPDECCSSRAVRDVGQIPYGKMTHTPQCVGSRMSVSMWVTQASEGGTHGGRTCW